MNDDEAIKFINSLVKNLQVLCHGSVEFKQKIEVVGHLYLNVDSDVKFDYIVNEKVCRNEQDSTTFVSNSFHAGPKKTIAERKKELEEELAKLQREQAEQYSNQQTFHMNNHRGNGSTRINPRDNTFQNNLVQQIALKRQASRNPMPDRENYHSQFKFPKASYDDMNAFQAKMSQQLSKINEKKKEHDQESRSTTISNHPVTPTPIDISAIKKEYISNQQEESSSCIFDRGRTGLEGSETNTSVTNETVFPGMTHDYKPSPQNFSTSPFHQSQTTSPSASLGSPYHSPMLQSPGGLSANRRKRSSFSEKQLHALERYFVQDPYPKKSDKERIAEDLNLSEFNVNVWFQNKRQKCKHTAKSPSSEDFT